jgi:hypothetical protein
MGHIEIFYKLSLVLARYLAALHKLVPGQRGTPVLAATIKMAVGHIFKFELYSPYTAYIYAYSLLDKNDQLSIS